MNTPRNVQAARMLLLAAALFSNMGSLGAKARPEYTKIDQPYVFFKALKGGKYPWMIKCHPGVNQWETVLCGTEDNGEARLVNGAADLAFLAPLSHSTKWGDANLEYKKEYTGYREAYLAIAFEAFFKSIGLMSDAEYKGTLLVDEYCEGLPMKIVVPDIEHFKAIKAYLLNKFNEKGIKPVDNANPETKPALLVEILDGGLLDADDKSFMNSYFDVVDTHDLHAKAFFESAQKMLNDIVYNTKDSKLVSEQMGEVLLRSMEKGMGKFEAEKMVVLALGFIVGTILIKYATEAIYSKAKGNLDHLVGRPART